MRWRGKPVTGNDPVGGKAFGPAPSGEGGRRTARAGEGARNGPERGRQAERPRRRGRAGPATMEDGVREPPCPGKGTRERPRWENGCGSGQCGRKRAGRTTRNAWVEEGGRDGKGGGFRSGECAWTGHMVRPGATAASGTGAQAECRSAGDPPRRSGNDLRHCRLQRRAEVVGVVAPVRLRRAVLPVAVLTIPYRTKFSEANPYNDHNPETLTSEIGVGTFLIVLRVGLIAFLFSCCKNSPYFPPCDVQQQQLWILDLKS